MGSMGAGSLAGFPFSRGPCSGQELQNPKTAGISHILLFSVIFRLSLGLLAILDPENSVKQ